MISQMKKAFGAPLLGAGVLLMVLTSTNAFAAETVKAHVPFAFQVGKKTMPAGDYELQVDRSQERVTIMSETKGPSAIEAILTYLAPTPHSDADHAHLVFDKVGNNAYLSEVWEPGLDGVLLHTTQGKHEHSTVHAKR